MIGVRHASGRGLVRTALAAVSLAAASACDRPTADPGPWTLDPAQALAGENLEGFERVSEPRALRFPEDHGPHPETKTEWWYVTGNLRTSAGRRFGFQFTVFRAAMAPPGDAALEVGVDTEAGQRTAPGASLDRASLDPPSAWATSQVYMAHVALTDPSGARYGSEERFSRGAVGLAGAQSRPFRVWVEDWALESAAAEAAPVAPVEGPDGIFPLRLRATTRLDEEAVALDLALEPGKALVLHGDSGVSRKGSGVGEASFYYSFTRLTVLGSIVIGDREEEVGGTAWLDREWSTSVLSRDQVGWDWWSLQLGDGRDLMLFQLRRRGGGTEPVQGTIVDAEGRYRALGPTEVVGISVTDQWKSPFDAAIYPAGWTIRLLDEGIDVEVRPVLSNQEFRHAFRYWEGAVDVIDRLHPEAPVGVGYVELTGYAGTSPLR